jgi:two-component system CheB/CheR fusion protein
MEENNQNKKKLPVVAIGASAGGIEAITELLTHLPADTGMAYVYIQHLSPTHESSLSSILSRETKMTVVEATDMVLLEPDHLYVIPPNKEMLLTDGRIKLEDRPITSRVHMPINRFFSSLADRYQETSIGIILSGSSNDGTIGLKAIRQAGGLTFAQDDTAKFQSMPKNAITEGAADMVLSPKEMAEELKRISKQKEQYYAAIADVEQMTTSSSEDLQTILKHLNKTTGVDFRQYKMNTITRRIARRMMLHKIDSMHAYAEFLKQNSKETNLLYQDVLINVTTFFRDKAVSEYERQTLLPALINSKQPNEAIRIWVPACSSGQEVYSLAILLFDILGKKAALTPIQIFGTDLSETAINKARLGVYSKNDVEDISPAFLENYFSKTDGQYRIIKSIRDVCVFATHNIAKDPPFSKLDIISCCNLLIYLDSSLQKKVLSIFHYSLNPNGYLILGQSEAIGSSGHLFSLIEKKLKIYSKKKDGIAKAMFEISYRLPKADGKQLLATKTGAELRRESDQLLEKAVDQLLLKKYAPAAVIINSELDILQFRGPVGVFLELASGKASLNLMKMARAGLSFELRNVVHKAKKTGGSVKKEGLEMIYEGKKLAVTVEASPLKSPDIEDEFYVVVFEETLYPPTLNAEAGRDERVKKLEAELSAVREDMRSIIESQEAANEELQSANEEIVSSNEELQSINEELETSKEEIESSNEELITINQELQERNEQLTEMQEYSEGLFAIARESMLSLDKDLRVKNANKSFYRTFHVKEEETIGRLLYELGNKQWDIKELRTLLEEVIPQNSVVENFEVKGNFETIGEKVMQLNAAKISQTVNGHHLILLAIEDITELTNLRKEVAKKSKEE